MKTTIHKLLCEEYENKTNNNLIGPHTEIEFNFTKTKVKAKVDTGAETNSIHCNNFYIKDGVLYCDILSLGKMIRFNDFTIKKVKNSNGITNDRYCVNLSFIINNNEYNSEFTLNDRSEMNYPVLIGKNFLTDNNFLVNVNETFKNTIRKFINEIKRSASLIDGEIDYNEFVDWAKGEADKITNSIDNFYGLGFQWAENSNGVKLIIYKDESPIAYVGLNKFVDGYKISTLGVKDIARGLGVATKVYDYIINKTTLYSDKMQTPEARKLWVKLFNKYKVIGYNKKDKQYFEVESIGDELKSKDSKYELYSEKYNNNYLMIKK